MHKAHLITQPPVGTQVLHQPISSPNRSFFWEGRGPGDLGTWDRRGWEENRGCLPEDIQPRLSSQTESPSWLLWPSLELDSHSLGPGQRLAHHCLYLIPEKEKEPVGSKKGDERRRREPAPHPSQKTFNQSKRDSFHQGPVV